MAVTLVVVITTQPGRGQEQRDAFARLAPLVREEAGCLRYDLHPVEGDADRFVLLETWESADHLAAHGQTPHMRDAARTNAAFRVGPPEVHRLGDAL